MTVILCSNPRCRIDAKTHEPVEPRRAADGIRLCWVCVSRLERHIAELPALYDELVHRLAASDKPRCEVRGGRSTGINLNDVVAKAREHIVVTLSSWAAIVADERGMTPPATDLTNTVAAWLTRHVEWLAAQPYVKDVAMTFEDTWREAIRARQASTHRRIELPSRCIERAEGPLSLDGKWPTCPGRLTAWLRDGTLDSPHEIVCSADPSHRTTGEEWITYGGRFRGAA